MIKWNDSGRWVKSDDYAVLEAELKETNADLDTAIESVNVLMDSNIALEARVKELEAENAILRKELNLINPPHIDLIKAAKKFK